MSSKELIILILSIYFSQLLFCVNFNNLFVAAAQVQPFTLASYYQDNMVLQRAPYRANIWGYAQINSKITATVFGKFYSATVVKEPWYANYIWTLTFDPITSDQPVNIKITETRPDGSTIRTLNNVIFGDVWVCSGQSNMQMSLSATLNGTDEINNSDQYTKIRLFTAELKESTTPIYDLLAIKQGWSLPSKTSLGNDAWSYFSGACWHFGKEVFKNTNVPLGLLVTAYSGTNIEKWLAGDGIKGCNAPKQGSDSVLWNAMIHPFFKYSVYGAVWYQGESNTDYNRDFYNCLFPAMIKDWRDNWYKGTGGRTNQNFPFGFVQLANAAAETTSIGSYPVIRWHQTADYGYVPNPKMTNVFMATAVDLVDNLKDTLHPRDKTNVGKRLALGALNLAYKIPKEYYSPKVSKITNTKTAATISFDSEFKPISLEIRNKTGLEICCNTDVCPIDNINFWRQITDFSINQDKLTFNLPSCCTTLKQVRYLWRQKPCEYQSCAIYSTRSQLPIYPFLYKF